MPTAIEEIGARRTKRNQAFGLEAANLQQKLASGGIGALSDLESRQRAFGVADAEDQQALADANYSWFRRGQEDPMNLRGIALENRGPAATVNRLAPGAAAYAEPRNFGLSINAQQQARNEQARQRAVSAIAAPQVPVPRGAVALAPQQPAVMPQLLPYTVDGQPAYAPTSTPSGQTMRPAIDLRAGKFQRVLNGKVDYYSGTPATAGVARALPRTQTRAFEPQMTDQADL